MAKYCVITGSKVRTLVKENGKRCGSDFLTALDRFVYAKIINCCKVSNGHKKTLDAGLVSLVK